VFEGKYFAGARPAQAQRQLVIDVYQAFIYRGRLNHRNAFLSSGAPAIRELLALAGHEASMAHEESIAAPGDGGASFDHAVPASAPVGVLLAVLGYAIGAYGAWLCGQILRVIAAG
jgi:hypothetical protein